MDTPKNIVYLLGAGASAQCLPVIDELPDRLSVFANIIQEAISFSRPGSTIKKPKEFVPQRLGALQQDVKWLIAEMKSHKTIDTLAKKFYLIKERHDDLIKLKRVLSAYFIFEQIVATPTIREDQEKELPDKRYDSFVATIISGKRGELTLSPTFKVLTWNYDIQLELAYQQYRPEYPIAGIQHHLQIVPTKSYAVGTHSLDFSKFACIKLNGIAGLTSFDQVNKETPKNVDDRERLVASIYSIANIHASPSLEESDYLNYSWENKDDYQYIYRRKELLATEANRLMKTADILVVIGYSFPIFNRSIDRLIFDDCPNLKKIYVQDKNADAITKLIARSFANFDNDFRTLIYNNTEWNIEIIPVTSVDQFFIPPESDI